jgi:hypothetical protein
VYTKQAEFNRELDELYRIRTEWLRHFLGATKKGPEPVFDRARVNRTIERLQKIASEATARYTAEWEFTNRVENQSQWHITRAKGFDRDAKKKSFDKWYDRKFRHHNCIYIFWGDGRSLYVGKTGRGAKRITSHFDKHWFNQATRIDVYLPGGRRELPILECLAIHRFKPKYNKARAGMKSHCPQCPICALNKWIDYELHRIFSLR